MKGPVATDIVLESFSAVKAQAKRHREALGLVEDLRRSLRSTLRDFDMKVSPSRASAILEGLAAEVRKRGALR